MPPRPPLVLALLLFVSLSAAAQSDGGAGRISADGASPVDTTVARRDDLDGQLFYAVYDVQNPAFVATMWAANVASLPLFAAAVPASGTTALLTGESAGPTGRLLLSELGAAGLVFAGKGAFERARPHNALPDVVPRQRRPPSDLDPYSFPSGHSALAFAIATSTSLSYPEWYVVAPAYLWATTTATARIWFGMHYPSDVAAGAAIGSGTALLVHLLLAGDDEEATAEATVPVVSFRIGL